MERESFGSLRALVAIVLASCAREPPSVRLAPATVTTTPRAPPSLHDRRPVALSAWGFHACVLRERGDVECWGGNFDGQTNVPVGAFKSIATGRYHTCGILVGGSIRCWGSIDTAPAGKFERIGAGDETSCAVRADGSVACWGASAAALAPAPALAFRDVCVGTGFACGLTADGTAACWDLVVRDPPGPKPPSDRFTALSCAGSQACGLRADGHAVCFGNLPLVVDGGATSVQDLRVDLHESARAVSAGGATGIPCILRADGSIRCMGGTTPLVGSFRLLSVGAGFGCAVRDDDTIACWGSDRFGQTTPPR